MFTEFYQIIILIISCIILGGLPLIWVITYILTGQNLAKLGTGNMGVQAAFYHGGNLVGILAVLSEALKGIFAVLLSRIFFPSGSFWELIALISLVIGRYFIAKGAGTTNVFWGYLIHDSRLFLLTVIIGIPSFTLFRERYYGKIGFLIIFPLLMFLLDRWDYQRIISAIALSSLLYFIYQKIPDDLDLSSTKSHSDTQTMFKFFQAEKYLLSLKQKLTSHKVGQKAATLSILKGWGYPVPDGWVLPPGDDFDPLIDLLEDQINTPLVVRSSVIGEDTETASAAGQYQTVLNITDIQQLKQAINFCLTGYDTLSAIQYRQDKQIEEGGIALIIQTQIKGVFSGVAFSRDPILKHGEYVIIEALPGDANQVVSGKITPEQYQVFVPELHFTDNWQIPEEVILEVQGNGNIPNWLIQQVAYLSRHLEKRFHGIPQDIEWSYDGEKLWILQSRPITTLTPIWTRKIAAEVIPGVIRPLTWSINQPLTCGVWGKIFTIVLGKKARNLDFNQTANLHYSHAYFNATLLGQIFLKMGLPSESLEFLTRGAKFNKPPLFSTLQNIPGLLRLMQKEMSLITDFKGDEKRFFNPIFAELNQDNLDILPRINMILLALQKATYYSIMCPLSVALRQKIFKIKDEEIDNSKTPEISAMRSLQKLVNQTQDIFPNLTDDILENLAENSSGQEILKQLDQLIEEYGYLSQVGTDISVETWRENPQIVRNMFQEMLKSPLSPLERRSPLPPLERGEIYRKKGGKIQDRVNLKGKVTEIYSKLLAELRYSFILLEKKWIETGILREKGDIFFLKFPEIEKLITEEIIPTFLNQGEEIREIIEKRRSQFIKDSEIEHIPYLFYGNEPPENVQINQEKSQLQLRGIGASPGIVEGKIKVLKNWLEIGEINSEIILVVPYTDSGWTVLIARCGGIIAEVGGSLSHGAIIAREYGLPAIMNVENATTILKNGQKVRINGTTGIVDLLSQ